MLTEGIQGLQKVKKKGKGVTKAIMEEREKQVRDGSVAQVCCSLLRPPCRHQRSSGCPRRRDSVEQLSRSCSRPSAVAVCRLQCRGVRACRRSGLCTSWLLSSADSAALHCFGLREQVQKVIEKIFSIPDGIGGNRRPMRVGEAVTVQQASCGH